MKKKYWKIWEISLNNLSTLNWYLYHFNSENATGWNN